MLGLCLDEQLGRREPMGSEAADELIGKADGKKGQGVSPVGGRVERLANREVRWRVPESKWSFVETPGKPVGRGTFGSKSCLHGAVVQLGELTQGADPEPPEEVGEHRQTEHLHREATEPRRRRVT